MKSNTHFFCIALFLFGQVLMHADIAYAVIANPDPVIYTQPDGSKLTILLKGDEFIHWAVTSDGYTIMTNSKGTYEYAGKDNLGRLVFSGIQANDPAKRSPAENSWLATTGKGVFFSESQIAEIKTRLTIGGSPDAPLTGGFPSTGTRKLLMILANFSNTTTTYTQTNFSNYMNQVNYNGTGSFRDYYIEVSYGQLTVNTTVTVWVTLPNTHDYYGPDTKWGEFAYQAVVAANNQAAVNFAEYDNNLDGTVDGVAIIHQGQGQEETGNINDIWSHSWDLSSAGYTYAQRTFDGVQVDAYTTMPERNATGMGTIGVMCHEFGHNLGSPDFYDTDYSTGGSYTGTGKWDLMAGGSWNGVSGNKPAHPNAWVKALFTWTSPVVLTTAQNRILRNAQAYTDVIRYNTTTSNEYFLCENRQQTGFDAGIPGHGLIIYHVDGAYITAHSSANNINATSHQGLYPVCATATGNPPTVYGSINSSGCPFPGTGNKTTFTDATTPHSHSWAGANTNFPLTSITENTITKEISFCFINCATVNNPANFSATPVSSSQINLTWTPNSSGNPVMVAYNLNATFGTPVSGTTYSAGNSISGGGTVLYNGTNTNFSHTGLNPNTTYYYKAWSVAPGALYSSGVTANAATPCSTYYPVSVSIAASANPVCTGTSVTFTATPVNGGTSPAWQWKVNGTNVTGATNATYSFIPSNNNTVTCVLTSNAACTTGNPATSNTVTMTVHPLLIVGSISASQEICAGATPVQLTGTAPLNGTSPTYQWQSSLNNVTFTNISGATILNFQPGALTATTYYKQLQNASGTCGGPLPTNVVTITVHPILPVSVTIAASANPVCAGISVTFTATPVNGGTAPAFQWKVNGTNVTGATNATYSFIPSNNDAVTCVLTSNAACTTGNPATSNTVTMTVHPMLMVGSISANQEICAGATPAQLTGTAPLNGTSPTYKWQSSLNNVTFTNISGATMLNFQPGALTATTYYKQLQNASGTCGGPLPTNVVTITVHPILPVSVTIAASVNPVCAGTSITLTATPVNGGTAPAFQWKVNGTNVTGATNATYSFIPSNNDAVTCVLTSNDACTTGNPATSNIVTMTVHPMLMVGSISANQSVCAGATPAQLTGTAPLNGTSPTYQWQSSLNNVTFTNISGATMLNFQPGALTATTYYKQLQNASGTCGGPLPSNVVTITVHPILPVSVTIAASANPVCAGTNVDFMATAINGGTSPAWQWKKNGISVSGATNATWSYIPANNDVITCELLSNAVCPTGNPATSNMITMTVHPLLSVSVTIAVSANYVCAGTTVTFTATAVNGGTSPAWQWKKNGTIVSGATNSTWSYLPVNNDVITCELLSNAVCPTGNPATSNVITMTVHPLLPVSVTIAVSANYVCAGTTVTFTATAVNGGTSPAWQWKKNGTTVSGATNSTWSYIPANNDVITCELLSNAVCPTGNPATSNVITMTVHPLLPVSVTIAVSANYVCAGTSVTFTATAVNGGTSPAWQWKKNGISVSGATNPTWSYIPVNNDVITCELLSNAVCPTGNPATSNVITMTVHPLLPVSVTIAVSANYVCAGTSVNFTATAVNGGTSPAWQWKKNGISVSGATNPTWSYIPVNNDVITCELLSNAVCPTGNPATSNVITMTVHPLLPVSVTIAVSANYVCAGTSVNFTATAVNGGTSPAWQWKKNGISVSGATNSTWSYIPANNDVITCELLSNAVCPTGNPATSNMITMTVHPLLPVSVTIAVSANYVCAGTTVTFTATAVNGGTSPAWQWKKNGTTVSGATNSTWSYIPANNDVITCELLSNAVCPTGNPATSNVITMTVHPLLPVSVTIAVSANYVCAGTSVTFTATAVNGGTSPAWQWKKNGTTVSGATNSTWSYIPANNDVITCELLSNAVCPTGNPATSNVITMTVHPLLPVSVTIAVSANNVCAGTSVTFTATAVNGGTSPAWQWKKNGINVSGATNPTWSYIPVNNDVITCELLSNAVCPTGNPATSNVITMTVHPLLPVSVTIAVSANYVCAGTSVNFTATAVNGGTSPAWQWKKNGVNVSGATNATWSYIPANNDVITCELLSNAVCPTGNPATSNVITMTVHPLLPVSVTIAVSANNVCAGTSVTFTATAVNGGTSPAWQWKKNGINVSGATNPTWSYIPVNNDVITCELLSNAVCPTGNPATSNVITMTVHPLLPVSVTIAVSANNVCAGTSVTFSATPVNGGSAPAFQWKVNGRNVPGATSSSYTFIPTNGNAVTCILTGNSMCMTGNPATSNTVIMTVNPLLPVSISINASANPVIAGTSVTFTTTTVNGGTTPTFQWKVNGSPVPGATGSDYTYIPANGDVIICILFSNALCAVNNPATSNSVIMSVTSIPSVILLQNLNITGIQCFDATQMITVAGGGSTFIVQNGGRATMIAGQKIKYLPGTRVHHGGYLHGYITTSGQYCGSKSPSFVTVADAKVTNAVEKGQHFFRVYPNPTDGRFVLELDGSDTYENIRAEIYNMTGEKMFSIDLPGEKRHEFSINGKPDGIYLLKVVSGKNAGTIRIIKR